MGGGTVPAGTWPGWYAAVIQLVGGTLVALGLGTRIAALVSSGSMAYAYFKVHQPESLFPLQNGGEASAVFCWAFLLLVFTGSGALALDRLFSSAAARGTRASRPARRPRPSRSDPPSPHSGPPSLRGGPESRSPRGAGVVRDLRDIERAPGEYQVNRVNGRRTLYSWPCRSCRSPATSRR